MQDAHNSCARHAVLELRCSQLSASFKMLSGTTNSSLALSLQPSQGNAVSAQCEVGARQLPPSLPQR